MFHRGAHNFWTVLALTLCTSVYSNLKGPRALTQSRFRSVFMVSKATITPTTLVEGTHRREGYYIYFTEQNRLVQLMALGILLKGALTGDPDMITPAGVVHAAGSLWSPAFNSTLFGHRLFYPGKTPPSTVEQAYESGRVQRLRVKRPIRQQLDEIAMGLRQRDNDRNNVQISKLTLAVSYTTPYAAYIEEGTATTHDVMGVTRNTPIDELRSTFSCRVLLERLLYFPQQMPR